MNSTTPVTPAWAGRRWPAAAPSGRYAANGRPSNSNRSSIAVTDFTVPLVCQTAKASRLRRNKTNRLNQVARTEAAAIWA
jgi:hypothetical protein